MPFVLPPELTLAVTWLVAGFALLRGGAAERVLAAIAIGIYALPQGVYGQRLVAEVAITATATAVLLVVALRSDKRWPLAAAAVGLVSLATNLTQMVRPVSAWAYGTACLVWEYLYLAVLTAAAWSASRRARTARPTAAGA